MYCLLAQIFTLPGAVRCSVLQCTSPELCRVAFWSSPANGWQRQKDTFSTTRFLALTACPFLCIIPSLCYQPRGEKAFSYLLGKVPYLPRFIWQISLQKSKNNHFLGSSTYPPTMTHGFLLYKLYETLKFQHVGII